MRLRIASKKDSPTLSYFARLAWKPEYGAGIASTAACLQNNGSEF